MSRFLSELLEPVPDNRSALEIVCDTAEDWAGEYGYGDPRMARQVFDAVREVRQAHGLPM